MHFFLILCSYIDVVFDWNLCFTKCQPIKTRFSETHGNIKNMSSPQKKVQTSFYSHISNRFPPGWVEKRRHFIRPMHLEFRLKTRQIWMKFLINCGFIFWQKKNLCYQRVGLKTCTNFRQEMNLSQVKSLHLVCCKPMILQNHHLLTMANDMLLPLRSAGTLIWSRIPLLTLLHSRTLTPPS